VRHVSSVDMIVECCSHILVSPKLSTHPTTMRVRAGCALAALTALAAAIAAHGCSTDLDCSLNGACNPQGACLCNGPWSGNACNQLVVQSPPPVMGYGRECPRR
jgi:hypothetical protein